ncbi:hypothetical protein M409DRAFT_26971 [Zasmidium cellare ATCC 36951]|uniref:Ubiquitin-like protease family profile domain-containing protein n=1 Tax=Zasmidium cellare ATCC 36951 TaxID=1080233 RepID=A0A6A6C6I6_ZASCE|nr:uncharacterized protein M409DRAFT_26971 [Zasmidium cellare ATCC 36951]KAF2162734.1 hypothetical protein M409DRAFT_26971 [Zasmidium cellare ATCC 36951]
MAQESPRKEVRHPLEELANGMTPQARLGTTQEKNTPFPSTSVKRASPSDDYGPEQNKYPRYNGGLQVLPVSMVKTLLQKYEMERPQKSEAAMQHILDRAKSSQDMLLALENTLKANNQLASELKIEADNARWSAVEAKTAIAKAQSDHKKEMEKIKEQVEREMNKLRKETERDAKKKFKRQDKQSAEHQRRTEQSRQAKQQHRRQEDFQQKAAEQQRQHEEAQLKAAEEHRREEERLKAAKEQRQREEARVQAEKERQREEEVRVEAAEKRQRDEAARFEAEKKREREQAEKKRQRQEEARLQAEQLARQQAEAQRQRTELARFKGQQAQAARDVLIRPLDPKWEQRVAKAMATTNGTDTLAVNPEGTPLTRYAFGKILPQTGADGRSVESTMTSAGQKNVDGWINDDAIDSWMCTVVNAKLKDEAERSGDGVPKMASFNCGWYSTFKNRGVQALKRWSSRKGMGGKKLLSVERVFMPLNVGAHWVLLIVSPRARTIEFLDSNRGNADKWFGVVRKWLNMELGDYYHADEWKELGTQSQRQLNQDDCGIFTCMNALASAKGKSFADIHAVNGMADARRMMVAVFLNGGLHGDWRL